MFVQKLITEYRFSLEVIIVQSKGIAYPTIGGIKKIKFFNTMAIYTNPVYIIHNFAGADDEKSNSIPVCNNLIP